MTRDLPPGWTWRRPYAPEHDAPAVLALVAACNEAVIGMADWTLENALDQLAEPGHDGERDGWLVHDVDGELAGYGFLCHEGGAQVGVEFFATDAGVAAWLLAALVGRADEVARGEGASAATIDAGVYREDVARQALLGRHGFSVATSFHRMRIDHDGAVQEEPPPSPGVTVRRGPGDDAFRRAVHAVKETSFTEHFGHVDQSYERWVDQIDSSPVRNWDDLWLAELDGEPVAMLQAHDGFVADEGCGYVDHVGVVPAARGRGVARCLLRTAFATDAARGRAGTLLHVDTNNPTPALALYLGLGMRPVLVIDLWRRPGG